MVKAATATATATATVLLFAALPLLVLAAPAPAPAPAQAATPAKSKSGDGGVERQPDFDALRYLGKWYEIARKKNTPHQLGTDNQANYALNANGTIAVRNVEWRDTHWYEVNGVATIVDNARLLVDFFLGPPGDYQVLQTDYHTYAVVYSYAGSVGSRKLELGWILARQSTLSQALLDQAYQVFESRTDLTKADFELTKHGLAPHPARHRLALYNEVPLQPNFDLLSYTGLWYEIYRTKNVPFESGTDITALYEPKAVRHQHLSHFSEAEAEVEAEREAERQDKGKAEGTVVSVTNSEWLPEQQKWSVIQGEATYVSNARFLVSFDPSQPGGADYRVLYTDYNNVAVVYSELQVGPIVIKYSWVLSRVPWLTSELEAKAFEVLQEAAGLARDKFIKTEHGVAPKH